MPMRDRATLVWVAAALALVGFGCSGSETSSPTTTTTSQGGGGQGGTAGAGGLSLGGSGGSGGVGATGGAGGAGATAGGGGTAGQAGAGGGGEAFIMPSLSSMALTFNCQPVVPADPVGGTFDAVYANSGTAPGTATITNVRILLHGNAMLTWSFDVDPSDSGSVPAGESPTVQHTKVADSGSGNGTGTPCDYCGGTVSLQVQWTANGGPVNDSLGPEPVVCAM